MKYIAITFAHGNGPYVRTVNWAIELNNIREEKNLSRIPIVVPLIYPDSQEEILRREINFTNPGLIERNPQEILFDIGYGGLLSLLMFKGKDYSENLEFLAKEYFGVESKIRNHLDGKRRVKTFKGTDLEIDLRDAELQLGLNNRVQTYLPNQFYTAGGAGPFDELLQRAIVDSEIKLNKKPMKKVLPIARRMMENQRIIFSNEPGVFSYDPNRKLLNNEVHTPPFVYPLLKDETELPEKGIYLRGTGIKGINESAIYDSVLKLGFGLFVSEFEMKSFPERIRERIITILDPSKMNNPNIIAVYGRAGWSSVWFSHLAEKPFLTPEYQKKDDPEMLFNERGIEKLGIGAIIRNDPKFSLEKAKDLSGKVSGYNNSLKKRFGTLDGIRYCAEIVAKEMNY